MNIKNIENIINFKDKMKVSTKIDTKDKIFF